MPAFIPLTRGGVKGKCVVVLSHQHGNTQLLTSSPMPPTSHSHTDFVDMEMQDNRDTRICIHEQSFRDVACQTSEDIENEQEENPQHARRAKTPLTPQTPETPEQLAYKYNNEAYNVMTLYQII